MPSNCNRRSLIDAVDPAAYSPEHSGAFSRPTVVCVSFNRREYHTLYALDQSDVPVAAPVESTKIIPGPIAAGRSAASYWD